MNRLFARLVDDAGLFPPTSLPMGDALARHRADAEADAPVLTHRFLCPLSRVPDLRRHDPAPIRLGLIVDTSETPDLDGLTVELVEVRPPAEALVPAPRRPDLLVPWLPEGARLFVEVPPHSPPLAVGPGVGLKVRCGGLAPEAFPSTHELGSFIRHCVSAGIPFKATAGLHHAVRHFDPSLGVYRHGFLNLVMAVCAAVEARDPVPVLDMCEPADLVRLARATSESVATRARELLVSYGSCSTTTPLADLAELGLVTGTARAKEHT
ncbi:hypothetical protein [Spongiactinospora sp. TRM90649]|uniref:hypothetical protein n=1 Tax=Spongiactinospora sp. TRM90649 TaxID=3031114 RepID=UPI0023F805AB|nr:hypothetical protein [Spongiactinospora sp. TRM90649]MDF5757764.1 hypothetical protein [Spongiactinospora sp. TRM90649]